MSVFLSILLMVVFSLIVALLSASEIAIATASRFRLHRLAKQGIEKADILLDLQKNTHTLISTIIFVNTCLFAGMTTLFNSIVVHALGKWSMFLCSLIMGGIMTFYLEVLPKVYAYQRPENVGLFLAKFIFCIKIMLSPVTRYMDWLAYQTLKIFRLQTLPRDTSREDLRGAIDLHQGNGLASYERAMLGSVLDLSQISVEEVMVHRKHIVSFNLHTPIDLLYEKILKSPYTRIPIWDGTPDNIVGVINVKRLAKHFLQAQKEPLSIEKVMRAPWFIPNTSTLFSQLQLFKERRVHQAFVVDEYGSLMGMVTLEDILEEIVGEIVDEHDVQLPGVRTDSQGNYIVQGLVSLRDLQRQYDWNFGEDIQASTLAGLILEIARQIPETGTEIWVQNFKMKILRRHHHQITLIKVTPPKIEETEESL